LHDAALLTLQIQRLALAKGMTLKDATAYNVQFHKGRPVFIDTLSFENYIEGEPWVAYRQFCQHFLAPLALMSHVDVGLGQLLRNNIDGIPLPLATAMLPKRTKFNIGLFMHLWIHSKSQSKATREQRDDDVPQSESKQKSGQKFSRTSFLGLIDSLENTVRKLSWKPGGSEWFDYYQANNNYSEAGLGSKEALVSRLVEQASPKTVFDMGGNTGRFSRLAAKTGASVVCWDIDPGCVEANYQQVRDQREESILPLLCDLSNPSPGIGWANIERMSIAQRGPVDMLMALGLIHHLAISNNVPLAGVAEFFHQLGQWLLIEFVPRADSQVIKLLNTRKDVFADYSEDGFETAFSRYFEIVEKVQVPETKRSLYLMKSTSDVIAPGSAG
jgi:ribosomal protein L11 methylase PrmA